MALSDSLLAYYKCDAASGDAIDAEASYDLTDTNTVGTGSGKLNSARDFTALNSEYFLSTNSAFDFGDTDFSISMWVNFTSISAQQGMVSKYNDPGSGQQGYYLYTVASTIIGVARNTSETSSVQSSTLSSATWYHAVFTHDATANEIALIIDDGTPLTTAHTGGVGAPTEDFFLGRWTIRYMGGLIDECGIWTKVLSAAEITALYGSGTPPAHADFGDLPASASGNYNNFLHAQIAN